jgi:hypothetical protein
VDNPHGSDLLAAQCENVEEGGDDEDGGGSPDDEDLEAEFKPVGDDDVEADVPSSGTSADPQPSLARKPCALRSTMPTWLANEYASVREKLTHEIERTASGVRPGRPACYDQGSFYARSGTPYLLARTVFRIGPGVFQQPDFFVWLPHCLLGDRIPCPSCKVAARHDSNGCPVFLQRLGWVEKPRRVVDIDKCVYIIGYRYRCGQGLCGRTYRSWSPAILDVLPPSLSAQFTFRLTYRSGLTNSLANLLHEVFRCGLGPQSFTSMVQSLHYHRYDELHLQYLEMLRDCKQGNMLNFFEKVTPFGAFGDRNGYTGFVPSAQYFRVFYDTMIEGWSHEIVLPARRVGIDESYKVNKYFAPHFYSN